MLNLCWSYREGMYVRVVGNIKSFQNTRNLTSYVIRPITDFNEITYHLLDSLYAHLEALNGPPVYELWGAKAGKVRILLK